VELARRIDDRAHTDASPGTGSTSPGDPPQREIEQPVTPAKEVENVPTV